ncbi:O-Glycosyl hydrolase family 17 protein [Abeliophyllum distichum]|uniref:O-Glycosyl hydrolase family 17 protein n=1 Tax=Abeliophyllum distichum TaxID=126358 RepID=A0ABD1VS49_9LAMI
MTSQRLIPSTVVDLFLQNRVTNVKVSSYSINVMQAFSGSGIGLTISIPNESLRMFISGPNPFHPTFWNTTYDNAVDVLRFVQIALNEAGCGNKIKATLTHFTDILKPNHSKPSQAEFRDDIKKKMIEYLEILKENNSPAVIDMIPVHFVNVNNVDLEFAFVDGNSTYFVVDDNGLNYTNVFDFMYDSFLWAMKKAGAPDLKLVVARIGWPTDGYPNANNANAERFWKGLLPKNLCDENKFKIKYGAFQRHWGIYRYDGKPKYKIDISGQGRDIYPTTAEGVTYMPKRWCIFNGDVSNAPKVKMAFETACAEGDCTSLMPGGSCSHLDFNQNVSYAFNRFFQAIAQKYDGDACQFEGLGKIVPDNPSTGTCIFPVEILAAEVADRGSSITAINGGSKLHSLSKFILLLPLLLIPFF